MENVFRGHHGMPFILRQTGMSVLLSYGVTDLAGGVSASAKSWLRFEMKIVPLAEGTAKDIRRLPKSRSPTGALKYIKTLLDQRRQQNEQLKNSEQKSLDDTPTRPGSSQQRSSCFKMTNRGMVFSQRSSVQSVAPLSPRAERRRGNIW